MHIVNATPVEHTAPKFTRNQRVNIVEGVFVRSKGKIVKIESDMNGAPAYHVLLDGGVGTPVLTQNELEAE